MRSNLVGLGGGTIFPKNGKLAENPVRWLFELGKGSPDSAGLSSRGVTRKEPCGVPPVAKLRKNENTNNTRKKLALKSAD